MLDAMIELVPTFVKDFHDELQVKNMRYNSFGKTEMKVSHISLGTGGFCLQYGDYSIEECKKVVYNAIKSGINYIDTAPWYGHGVSEEVLGKCLIGIPRQAYYIATKIGRYEANPKLMFDFSVEKTKNSLELSLKKLGVQYIDVLQVHDIEFAPLDVIVNETIPFLKQILKSGKIKYIGITGYYPSVLKDCLEKSTESLDMVLSYSRLSLLNNDLKDYLNYFKLKGLGIVNAAGNCMGLLTNGGPQPWHPASEHIKEVCSEARHYCQSKEVELARLSIYYCFQQEGPDTHLIGLNTTQLLQSNLDVLHNGLSELEHQVLKHIQERIFSKLKTGQWEKELFEKTVIERH